MLPPDWLELTLWSAVERGASDIHVEPFADHVRVRLRVDGFLLETQRLDVADAALIATRIKVAAQLDIAERHVPQDGRLTWQFGQAFVDFRVSVLPTLHGEKAVLRLQDRLASSLDLPAIGLEPEQELLLRRHLDMPHGLILVTGPTGSGKTVTLYAGLQYLNRIYRNVSTVEDPIELAIEGINQVAMNPRRGLNFATVMKGFLRQDPDVLMVGEIRDPETADIAVKAAQTGHLVLSTLHTNDAPQAVQRLASLGVPLHDLADSLSLVVAQRLVRRLHNCGGGCRQCNQGFRGRAGIFELLPLAAADRPALQAQQFSLAALREHMRRCGQPSLKESGDTKVAQGITVSAEVIRVCLEN
ncbi:GspE/PulE family protein [Aquilutibacter rugosus]|uniref:GspE/PulE family protein n=1 Tax=Aquilutibacter rugosus TaxID=3115820 RepID=UPI002F3E4A76